MTSLVKPTPITQKNTRALCALLGALLFACERPPTQNATPAKREALSWEWLNPLPQGERLTAAWVKSGAEAFFASPSHLVYTKDSGASWRVQRLPRRVNIARLWGEGEALYALSKDAGVLLVTTNGGEAWEERPASAATPTGETPAKTQEGAPGVYYEAADGSARYLVEGHRISLSLDSGATWRALSTGEGYAVAALSRKAPRVFQAKPGELYAVNAAAILWGGAAGNTWTKSAGEALSARFAEDLCAASPTYLYCYDQRAQRLLQLASGAQQEARALSFEPTALATLGELLVARQSNGLLSQSRDQGATWQDLMIEQERPVVQRLWSLSPSSLYLKVERQLWYTQDSGASWKKAPFLFLPEVSLFEGQGTIFVINQGEVYFLSGATWDIWRDSLQKFRYQEERAEGIFFLDKGEILVATTLKPAKKPSSNRLLLSDDDGLTWRAHTLSLAGEAGFDYGEQRVWVSPSREVFVLSADLKLLRGTFQTIP